MWDVRKDIISVFEKGIFPYKGNVFKTKEEEERVKKIIKYIENELKGIIENELKGINYDIFKKHFNFAVIPSSLTKQLYKIKNKNKNNELVNLIKSGLSDLKDEIKEMSEDEKSQIR